MSQIINFITLSDMETVGILGCGEIGSAVKRICEEAGYRVFVRELKYDELARKKVDYLQISIPEKNNLDFIKVCVKAIKELEPKLTIINSSVTPGTTRKIFKRTKRPIVHSPVIGLHPNLYDSIKHYFVKVVGPVDQKSKNLAKKHFRKLGIKIQFYDSPENSEAAKLMDLVYYAWNIVFCKWTKKACDDLGLNFDQVYKKQTEIYNQGYGKLQPNVIRPILVPVAGPISGHCTIPDVLLFDKIYPSSLTKYILKENKKYFSEIKDLARQRRDYLRLRNKKLVKNKRNVK